MSTKPLPKPKPWYRFKKSLDRYLGMIGKSISNPIEAKSFVVAPAPPAATIFPPVNYLDLPSVFNSYFEPKIDCPGQTIYNLQNAKVAWHGTVVKGLRVFVPSLPYPFLEPEYAGTFLLRQITSINRSEFAGPVGLVFDQWSGNYFHWMAEVLPRLAVLRKFSPDCLILLPGPKPQDFIIETVKAFGFKHTYIMSPGEMVNVPNLLVAALPGIQGYITPSLVRQSKDTVLAHVNSYRPLSKKAHRKVYVSRSRQSWRHLTNEEEILRIVHSFGFEVVHFEDFSFFEQVALMHETAIFISLHGANMTNILFMQSGGQVIEMLSETYINISYLHMSNSLGLKYYIIPSTVGSPPEVQYNYADITTDASLVNKVLRIVCDNHNSAENSKTFIR